MLCLLRDKTGKSACDYPPNPGPWRQWIDMEHSTCYNMSNHWSALTNGEMKFIYRAWAGDFQLFNLTADPGELTEVSTSPEYASETEKWRSRMVKQFEVEARGTDWVKDGQLVKRSKGTTYSPFYPRPSPTPSPKPARGSAVVMRPNGGTANCGTNDCWLIQTSSTNTTIPLKDVPSFCLSVANTSSLVVDECQSTDSQRFLTRPHSSGNGLLAIKHVASGKCVSAGATLGSKAELAACVNASETQLWLYGASGRFCASKAGDLCLHVGQGLENMPLDLYV